MARDLKRREKKDEAPEINEDAPPPALFGGGLINIKDAEKLMEAMEDTADIGGRNTDMSYMSFSGKRGTYKIGVNDRQPDEEEPFLIAVTSFEVGWMCWKNNKPVSKRMELVTRPAVPEPDFEEYGPFDEKRGEGWHRARAITMRSMTEDEQCYFSITSKSGVAALSDLQRDVLAKMREGDNCWPIVYLTTEEFEAQGYKNYKPAFEVVKWVSSEDVIALGNGELSPLDLVYGEEEAEAEEEQEEVKPEPPKRRRAI